VVTIALGLFFAGWWPSTWLQRERRVHHLPESRFLGRRVGLHLRARMERRASVPRSRPILGLAASSSGATALRGSILAFFYCLGLGVPSWSAALATEWMATASTWFSPPRQGHRHHRGVLLIIIGVCEVTGWWHAFVLWLQIHFPASTLCSKERVS